MSLKRPIQIWKKTDFFAKKDSNFITLRDQNLLHELYIEQQKRPYGSCHPRFS